MIARRKLLSAGGLLILMGLTSCAFPGREADPEESYPELILRYA